MQYRIMTDFDAAHFLPNYNGPCARMHGHTWKAEFYVQVPDDRDPSGIGIDFKVLKRDLNALVPDHELINDFLELPSAENIVWWLHDAASRQLPAYRITKIVLWETERNAVEYAP